MIAEEGVNAPYERPPLSKWKQEQGFVKPLVSADQFDGVERINMWGVGGWYLNLRLAGIVRPDLTDLRSRGVERSSGRTHPKGAADLPARTLLDLSFGNQSLGEPGLLETTKDRRHEDA